MTRDVMEWRVTHGLGTYTIRYWIESHPDHGGIEEQKVAVRICKAAERAVSRLSEPRAICRALLDLVPAANSIEVIDATGAGVAMHRDWP